MTTTATMMMDNDDGDDDDNAKEWNKKELQLSLAKRNK